MDIFPHVAVLASLLSATQNVLETSTQVRSVDFVLNSSDTSADDVWLQSSGNSVSNHGYIT